MTPVASQRPFRSQILRALLRREFTNLLQHPYHMLALILPLFMSFIFLIILPSTDEADRIQVVIYDPEGSMLVSALAQQPYIDLITVASEAEVTEQIEALGEAVTAGLIVPAGVDTAVAHSQPPNITAYLNEDARSTNQARFQQYLTEQIWALRSDTPPIAVTWNIINETGSGMAISLEHYLFVSMTMLGLTLVTMIIPQTMMEEKSEGTLQPLLTSPAAMPDLLLAKAILAIVYGLVVTLTMIIFHGGWEGNWGITSATLLLTLLFLTAVGLLLGVYGKNKAQNNTLITLITLATNLPCWFAVVAISSLPTAAAFVLQLLPTHYTVKITTLALAGNASLANTAVSFTILTIITLALWGWLFWKVRDTAVLINLIAMES